MPQNTTATPAPNAAAGLFEMVVHTAGISDTGGSVRVKNPALPGYTFSWAMDAFEAALPAEMDIDKTAVNGFAKIKVLGPLTNVRASGSEVNIVPITVVSATWLTPEQFVAASGVATISLDTALANVQANARGGWRQRTELVAPVSGRGQAALERRRSQGAAAKLIG